MTARINNIYWSCKVFLFLLAHIHLLNFWHVGRDPQYEALWELRALCLFGSWKKQTEICVSTVLREFVSNVWSDLPNSEWKQVETFTHSWIENPALPFLHMCVIKRDSFIYPCGTSALSWEKPFPEREHEERLRAMLLMSGQPLCKYPVY